VTTANSAVLFACNLERVDFKCPLHEYTPSGNHGGDGGANNWVVSSNTQRAQG
jgi:hypothetical protein